MTVAELNFRIERTQLLTNLANSEKIHICFRVTQSCSNSSYVEGSSASLYDCLHHLSPLYIIEKCYDKSPFNSLDTVVYIDPNTRQTFECAN